MNEDERDYYFYLDIIPYIDEEFGQITADVREVLGSSVSHRGPAEGYEDGSWFRIEGSYDELRTMRKEVRRLSRGKRKFSFEQYTINSCIPYHVEVTG